MSARQKCDTPGCYLGCVDWGSVGKPKIVGPSPVRCEHHWDIEICRVFELLEFCSRRLVVLCCRVIERIRADRKGVVWC